METIPPLAALAALVSAMAHAGMALYTKRAEDTLTFRALSNIFSALWLSPVLFLFPVPGWEVWRFLILGAALIWAFNMLMISAFRRGSMNLVYPVMRGAAPAIAGLFAFVFLGEPLSPLAILGLSAASAAIIAFAWPEKGGAPKAAAIGFALSAAMMTASYTVNDASGVRAAGSALLYAAWFFVLSATSLTLTAWVRRGDQLPAIARTELRGAVIGSFFNVTTYGLALYAYANAPVAPMAALRETSVVFGAILAALILKEPLGVRRIALAVVLALGLAAIQLG
ncbi:EamA family transporter [Oceanicaulis sp. LC35]|uniref:EamA family transporter n=1 Tax=Oceanicaulis sp. LC35 TaxID=3349635 RepID=UPI003F8627E0